MLIIIMKIKTFRYTISNNFKKTYKKLISIFIIPNFNFYYQNYRWTINLASLPTIPIRNNNFIWGITDFVLTRLPHPCPYLPENLPALRDSNERICKGWKYAISFVRWNLFDKTRKTRNSNKNLSFYGKKRVNLINRFEYTVVCF